MSEAAVAGSGAQHRSKYHCGTCLPHGCSPVLRHLLLSPRDDLKTWRSHTHRTSSPVCLVVEFAALHSPSGHAGGLEQCSVHAGRQLACFGGHHALRPGFTNMLTVASLMLKMGRRVQCSQVGHDLLLTCAGILKLADARGDAALDQHCDTKLCWARVSSAWLTACGWETARVDIIPGHCMALCDSIEGADQACAPALPWGQWPWLWRALRTKKRTACVQWSGLPG